MNQRELLRVVLMMVEGRGEVPSASPDASSQIHVPALVESLRASDLNGDRSYASSWAIPFPQSP